MTRGRHDEFNGAGHRGSRVRQCADHSTATQLHLHRGAARNAAGGARSDHRGHRPADGGRRSRRCRPPVMGGDELSARLHHRHRRRRKARRPVRPQAGVPGRGAVLPRGFGAVRPGRVDDDAGRRQGAAGHRRWRDHGDGDGGHRRGDPASGTRPVPGRTRRGVRRDDGDRPAVGWLLHRSSDVAVGVLDQHSGRGRGADRRRRRHPVVGLFVRPRPPSRSSTTRASSSSDSPHRV